MNIYAVFFFILFGAIIVWEVMRHLFVKELLKEDYQLWLKLGSPKGIVGRLFILDGLQLEKFIFLKQYESLGSQKLLAFCIRLHSLQIVVLVTIIIIILSFLFF